MEAGGPKDLSHFFAAMLGVQRHLLGILKAKGPEEATAYASDLTGSSKGKSQTTAQLALPCMTEEDDPATFISLFERAALSARLPEEEWVPALASLLTTEASDSCSVPRGGGESQFTFQDLKAALLDRTLFAEESCRVRFRLWQGVGQAPRALARELLQEASGWLKPRGRSGWEVAQCVVMEQFAALLADPVAEAVRAARPVSLDEAVQAAETHFLLSADSAQGKEAGCEVPSADANGTAHSAFGRNCATSPQRIPDEAASPTKLQSNTMKIEATETFTVYEQAEINAEESKPRGAVQHLPLSSSTVNDPLPCPPLLSPRDIPLPPYPPREDSRHGRGVRNPGSDTSGEGDESEQSLGCNALRYPDNTASGHRGQQNPSGPAAAEEEGEGEGGYACGACGKTFLFFKSLHRHQRVHGGPQGPFLCAECGFPCRSTTGLKRHRAVHSGSKLLPCPDCDGSFTYAERLVHHRTAHAALRPHRCAVCQKSFRLKKVLKKHEQIHR